MSNLLKFNKYINLLPGPVYIPEKTKKYLSLQPISQRNYKFERIYFLLQDNIKQIIDNPEGEIIIFTGSGTLAMEATIANLLNKNSYPLVIINGKFGKRFSEILKIFNIKHDTADFLYKEKIDYTLIEKILKKRKFTHLIFQATETSTGNKIDFNFLNYYKSLYNVDLICDAISHVLSEPFSQTLNNIDCVIMASQKGFSTSAGISFVSLSKKYVNKILFNTDNNLFNTDNNLYNNNIYYYDFKKYLLSKPPFTPAINIIYSLYYNTNFILKAGVKNIINKNIESSLLIKNTLLKVGLKLFSQNPSHSVTVFEIKNANNFIELLLKKYNILCGKGQEDLNNRVVRIGHMGLTPLKFYKKLARILKKEITSNRTKLNKIK